MKLRFACLFAAGLLAVACAPAVRKSASNETVEDVRARRGLAEKVVAGWAENARLAARELVEKYGAPDEVRSASLVWKDNGPWTRTVVRDLPPPYAGAKIEELGVVEQTISYVLRPDQAEPLQEFGKTLIVDTRKGELTVRSDSEAVNFLRVNLADDVVNNRLTVEQARQSHARLLALEAAGKSTGYLRTLRFGEPTTP